MKLKQEKTIYSPSDLSNYIHCKHLTSLDKEALDGKRQRPNYTNKVMLALRERGENFEAEFLKQLEGEGKSIFSVQPGDPEAYAKTLSAMKEGFEVIYQARLGKAGEWEGWADFLIRVDRPSGLGEFSYEVMDTKLATETKAATIIQISLYSEAVGEIQGIMPEWMWVKTPEEQQIYRVDDYLAYVRLTKKRFLEAIKAEEVLTYPEPISHCDICVWWEVCNQQRRADDHLGFVAGMGASQVKEVKSQGYETLGSYAQSDEKITFKPNRGAVQTFQKLRDQANIQWRSREENHRPIHELLELEPDKGFFKLPEPSKHDVYLDFEGDPLVEPGGLEYMIGWYYQGEYHALWAENEEQEKQIFEDWMDRVMTIKQAYPDMHIYHYAPYETTALKRLAGKYVTRQEELDKLLRSRTFVDLYGVVRQAVRASVERYSIKDLEKFFGYVREIDLREVSKYKSMYEFLLETQKTKEATHEMKEAIRLYNQDDCISTERLHHWLESLRSESIRSGKIIPRPEIKELDLGESASLHLERIKPLMDSLLQDMPISLEERTPEQQGRYLLAHMLNWFRREDKSKWWEFFRLKELSGEELLDEKSAIGLLTFTGNYFPDKQSIVYEYTFPVQEIDIKIGGSLDDHQEGIAGIVYGLDTNRGVLQLKKGPSLDHSKHPANVIYIDRIPNVVKEEAIIRLASWVLENGLGQSDPPYRAVRSLLMRERPKVQESPRPNEDLLEFCKDWASKMDYSYLPIQGPPGSGKSYTASRMILDLIVQGKKVGLTAMSHKVIDSLLESIWKLALNTQTPLIISQKPSVGGEKKSWRTFTDNKKVESEMKIAHLLAGTPFLFANELIDQQLDYLFIDEAGQLSLIDTLACGLAAKNLVLLGDPQQLQQPQQGVHPEGTEVSALAHILQDKQTIPADQGIFLDKTWRMHPAICAFNSEQFYENKLLPIEGLERQKLSGNTPFQGSGLKFVPVEHEGNTNASKEEVDRIRDIVQELIKGDLVYTDYEGKEKTVTAEDIKIIAPYNAQVNLLKGALPAIDIGTVDKFQGQEAPVMIYSVATSSPQEAPRGMDFLYSPNRFNVAVSRAKAMFILVAAPAIFEPDCNSPAQIKLANPFCRYMEMGDRLEIK